MSEQLDTLLQKISELTQAVQSHKTDPATLDPDALKTALTGLIAEQTVIRRGEQQAMDGGEWVGPEGFKVLDPRVREGKFAGLRRSEVALVGWLLARAQQLRPEGVKPPSAELLKAMNTTSTTGGELVPTGLAAQLWADFFLSSRVAPQFARIAMPTDPYDIPLNLGDVTWRKGTQNTATTASDPATAKSTMTTTEQIAEVDWSYTLDEDAIIAMLPSLRARLQQGGAEAIDAFILNADGTDAGTGNINLDDANPADTSYYLSAGQDGIRHEYLVDKAAQTVNAGGDALTDDDIIDALKLRGKYSADPTRSVLFCDVSTYLAGLLNLDGVQTLDKYGQNAVLLTGELARYRGIPVIPSASMPLTEADGAVSTTAGNNTLGQIAICHRDFWNIGFRRELLMEVDRDITKRQFILVVSFRIAVACHTARASATHTAGIRNILVA